jgi:predicted O-methyltransferase YrrM
MPTLTSLLMRVQQRISPVEREFRRCWPLIDAVEGFLISPDQERWLFKAAKSLPDHAVILEIGSFKGRSTCCLAFGCRGSRKHVFAVDTFEGNEKDFRAGVLFDTNYYSVLKGNIERNGLTEYVTTVTGTSADVGKTWNTPIHLLFIDGGHEYEDVLADFQTFFPHVVPGGMVAFHDVHNFETDPDRPAGFPGVLRVWNEYAAPRLSDRGMCATLAFGRKSAV